MKLLYCELCGDILAPYAKPLTPRYCQCGVHAVWWVNPAAGVLRIYDTRAWWTPVKDGEDRTFHAWSRKRSPHLAYVIGLHNQFLQYKGHITGAVIRSLIELTPFSYVFKTIGSMVIRIRPGESNDTDWAEYLPGCEPEYTSPAVTSSSSSA